MTNYDFLCLIKAKLKFNLDSYLNSIQDIDNDFDEIPGQQLTIKLEKNFDVSLIDKVIKENTGELEDIIEEVLDLRDHIKFGEREIVVHQDKMYYYITLYCYYDYETIKQLQYEAYVESFI